jgi:transglutaminase-like putative cysteine protease
MKMPSLFLGKIQDGARPMSREKADTLLLLLACASVLLPQFHHVPTWVTATSSILMLWRGWITFRGNRMPPHWLLLPIAIASMAGVFAAYKTLLGREAGVTMLFLLLSLKLLEMRARRDLFVVVFLSFFLLLTNFFNSQSIGTAVMTVLTVVLILTAQLSFQYTGRVPPLMRRLKLAAVIVVLAVPLTVVLFFLFPRIQGPLWRLPGDAASGHTGMSDTMSPGNFSNLALSDDVAFRVKFEDAAPPQQKLYWRGLVLDTYDGRTWSHKRNGIRRDVRFRPNGNAVRYQVTLEPQGKHWLFVLEMPQSPPIIAGLATAMDADFQSIALQPIDERLRYDAESYPNAQADPDPPSFALQTWLQLPPDYDPLTRQFAEDLRRQTSDDVQRVNAVLAFFRTKQFSYTLEPPMLGRNAIDEFLFSTRAGFCEHYSSAFVVLMRAMHIPARVVNGYQGGEVNPVNGLMTVRQSDAHAWAEVWLRNTGWVRVDPTAAVAPERVRHNLASALPRTMLGGLIDLDIGRKNSWLASLRFDWDAFNNAWNQWVLNYSVDKQKNFVRSLGLDASDWRDLAMLLAVAGGIVMIVVAYPLLTARQKVDPVRAVYLRFCQLMANRGLPRALHEGPRDYRMRIAQSAAVLPPEKKSAAERFLAFYETVQYGRVSGISRNANNTNRSAEIAQLKSLLAECR